MVALGRRAAADWTHSSDQVQLHKMGWLDTFGSTKSKTNTVVVVDYAAVDLALPSLGVEQKVVDFRAFADHQK